MTAGKHIIIAGSGAVGLCVAYYAARRGHRVTVLEQGAPERDCCSLGNAGMIVPSHFVPLAAPGMVSLGLMTSLRPSGPLAVRATLDPDLLRWGWRFARCATAAHVSQSAPLLRDLSLASRRCFEELDAQWDGAFGLQRRGLLMLCSTPHVFEDEARLSAMARQLGLEAEVLSAEDAARLEPALRMEIAGAVYYPQDCHLAPGRFMDRMLRAVRDQGVETRWSTAVTGWRSSGGRVTAVCTSQGDIAADEFVVAAGAWTGRLVRSLGQRLLLQPGKGYSLTLPQPRTLPAICAILVEARVAVTPVESALRFAGTMELGAWDRSIAERRVRGMVSSVTTCLPDFASDDFRDAPVWVGHRPCSPDGLPYIGRFARYSNLSVATGHGMMGLNLAPITGLLLSEILCGEPPAIDIGRLRPDRWG